MDEHIWQHGRPGRPTGYATSITDLSPGRPPRLLDLVEGRSGAVLASWLAQRGAHWCARIEVLAYFITGRTSNGPTEAINLGIETSRRIGQGFRNFTNYRTRQLLAHGGLTCDHETQRIRRRRPRFVA